MSRAAGKDVPDERDIMGFLHVVAAMDIGITRQREPLRWGYSLRLELGGAIALGRKDEVKGFGLLAAPHKVKVRIDRPPGRRMQLGRQVILEAVIDIQVEVEALPRNGREFVGAEVDDINKH